MYSAKVLRLISLFLLTFNTLGPMVSTEKQIESLSTKHSSNKEKFLGYISFSKAQPIGTIIKTHSNKQTEQPCISM